MLAHIMHHAPQSSCTITKNNSGSKRNLAIKLLIPFNFTVSL